MDHFRPGGAATACSTVEISIACKNLVDMDTFSKSDPMCVLFVKEFGRDVWIEFGRTEIIWNNLNPEWAKKFLMNYFFEERQFLKFEVYDVDSESPDLKCHDFLGRYECTLGEIVSVGKIERPLQGGPKADSGKIVGTIVIGTEEVTACKEELTFRFEAKKLDKKDWFGKSDPFLTFYRANEDGTFTVVHRTEYIKNTLNPVWKEFNIPARTFCGGDYNRSILIRCFDWNRSGKEDLIGECTTNVQDMQKVQTGQPIVFEHTVPNLKRCNVTTVVKEKRLYTGWSSELVNSTLKTKKSSYKNSGQLFLKYFRLEKLHSFVDYVLAGTQLNCTIAIDFTASNGAPTQQNSLHYIHPHFPNHYHRALTAVGEIIQDYDTDKLFPVLGFGARLPPDGRVSHEFFVNGSPDNPFCQGISGVISAYQNCLMNVQLYGPTNFAPCVNHVARFAATKRNGSEYFILLIITDGIITDMPQTKEAIVAASCLPLSIIIVGVGSADFDAMKELDGDEVRLSSNGRYAERDIVQFVPFRDFVQNNTAADMQISQARLAKEVLAEIPDQFLSYMRKHQIAPGSWNPGGRPLQQPTAAGSQFPPISSVKSGVIPNAPVPSGAPGAHPAVPANPWMSNVHQQTAYNPPPIYPGIS